MTTKSAALCLLLAFLVSVSALPAQDAAPPQKAAREIRRARVANAQNMDAYIKLLRKDVRSQKSEVMSEVMQLDPDQAAKFWPIYRDYDAELSKVNDLRIANIKEYADSYNQMTDAKADELIHSAMAYQKQRAERLAKYYERMKQETGAVTAARFVQVEYQMLLIIDLQILSSLPVAGS
ncbi:MAG TPA: hypothetical protein VK703_09735 [Candidatus Acidoferrales bacterium]|nr:hypothetical protein [Candidatus Acidoferrales bacterium]